MSLITMFLLGLLVVAGLVGAEVLWESRRSGRLGCRIMPRPYGGRESLEGLWRQRFQDGAMDDAETVLDMFCEAFLFNPDHRYRFSPNDGVIQIYRVLYPSWFWPVADAMEIENLLLGLEKRFGFQKTDWRNDITLGDIVEICNRKRIDA